MNKGVGIKLASKVFNENGSFKEPLDPCRFNRNTDNKDFYYLLFDGNGNAIWLMVASAQDFVKRYNCPWNSDIVKYIYSAKLASFTDSNYSSIYAWR